MKNGIAVVETLRSDSALLARLPAGAVGIAYYNTLLATPEPYVCVMGGSGGEPEYALGNVEICSDDVFVVHVSAVSTETQSDLEIIDEVLELVDSALANLVIPGRRVLNLRRLGDASFQLTNKTTTSQVARSGQRYQLTTGPA